MPLRPCLDCGKLGTTRRCKPCESVRNKARDDLRGSPTQRGLGHQHRLQVQALIDTYTAEHGHPPTHCPSCHSPYIKGTRHALSGQHSTARAHDKHSQADQLLCVACNSSEGARIRKADKGQPPKH